MTYPLAHDENGFPIKNVPPKASGWLVRGHGGDKGRPRRVYDSDGRPLQVALSATADDLRAAGCPPGPYRLDAVDDEGQPLGIVAYTELPGDAGEDAVETGDVVVDKAGQVRRKDKDVDLLH